MIVCLLRLFAIALPAGLLSFVFPFMFCSETKRATAFDSMTMSLLCRLSIFWVAILLHHFIVLYHITLSHCENRTCGIACFFFILLSDVVEERFSPSPVVGSLPTTPLQYLFLLPR